MKMRDLILVTGALILFAGCATPPDNTSDIAVRIGMTTSELKVMYGEPLRVESDGSGGENWYYHFYSWGAGQTVTVSSQTTDAAGNTLDSSSEDLQVGKGTMEEPIHVSAEGYVVAPLPSGKVIKN
ncbi:MAG TPA: hypothetical protein VGJ73_00240 [Verrucomicrobiae bacterium]